MRSIRAWKARKSTTAAPSDACGDGGDDDDQQHEHAGTEQHHAADLDSSVAARDALPARLPLAHEVPGLAVAAERFEAPFMVVAVVGDVGDVLPGDAADRTRPLLGHRGGLEGVRFHSQTLLPAAVGLG